MKATITIETPRAAVERFLDGIYAGAPVDPAPDALEWFRQRIEEICDDEIPCAVMFSMPNVTVAVLEVTP